MPANRYAKGQPVSHSMQSIRGGLIARLALPAVATLLLAACQTTADSAVQGDIAAPEAANALPVKKANGANPYSDPLVVSASSPASKSAAVPAGDSALTAYAPASANLGELTMQPTSVNASRNSLFSQAPAAEGFDPTTDITATTEGANTGSTGIVVPADLPTRQVNAMSKSLFSADLRQPEPPVVGDTALPVESAYGQPVYTPEEQPVYAEPGSAALPITGEDRPEVVQAAPNKDEPAADKKRKWLPSIAEVFGRKKS